MKTARSIRQLDDTTKHSRLRLLHHLRSHGRRHRDRSVEETTTADGLSGD